MFSARTLILLGATIYMLPSDPQRQQQFVATATSAYQSVITVCDRQAALCDKAGNVFDDLKSKAHFGAGVVYALVTGANRAETSTSEPAPPAQKDRARWEPSSTPNPGDANGTLTKEDLTPIWRGRSNEARPVRFD